MSCKHVPTPRRGIPIYTSPATCQKCGKIIEVKHPFRVRCSCLFVLVVLFHLFLASLYCRKNNMWILFIIIIAGCVLLLSYVIFFAGKKSTWHLRQEYIEPTSTNIQCRHRPSNPAISRPFRFNTSIIDTGTQACKKCGSGVKPQNVKRLKVITIISIIIQWHLIHSVIDYFVAFALGSYSTSTIPTAQSDRLFFLWEFVHTDIIEIILFFSTFSLIGYLSKWEIYGA